MSVSSISNTTNKFLLPREEPFDLYDALLELEFDRVLFLPEGDFDGLFFFVFP